MLFEIDDVLPDSGGAHHTHEHTGPVARRIQHRGEQLQTQLAAGRRDVVEVAGNHFAARVLLKAREFRQDLGKDFRERPAGHTRNGCRNHPALRVGKVKTVEEKTEQRELLQASADLRRCAVSDDSAAGKDAQVGFTLADKGGHRRGGLCHTLLEIVPGILLEMSSERSMHHQRGAAQRKHREGDDAENDFVAESHGIGTVAFVIISSP
jgi:hypothetical protein